ncbi:MAG: hypothetical protein R3B06_14560 [Kofleriaceae bacterium]
MRCWLGSLALVLACGNGVARTGAPLANRAAPVTPSCPLDRNPLAQPPSAAPPDDACLTGAPAPLLDAPADAPSCHAFVRTDATTAHEGVTLPDGRRVWVAQGGCVHATLRFQGAPTRRVDPRDRVAVIGAGAGLLRDLAPMAAARGLDRFVDELAAAAATGPTGTFPIGAGDWYADVEVAADGTVAVTLDFPM